MESTWERVGRGLTLQFFATDDEVQRWLSLIDAEFGGCFLFGDEEIRNGHHYEQKRYVLAATQWMDAHKRAAGRMTSYAVGSTSLSPHLLLRESDTAMGALATAGFVLLDHGFMREGAQESSAIALVDRVRDSSTGSVRRSDYLPMFRRLRALIESSFRYRVLRRFLDGHEEESSLEHMTEGAKLAWERGHAFSLARPGRAVAFPSVTD